MPRFESVPSSFVSLNDKVIVLTGGANGIGECVVRSLYAAGAHIVFGDIDEPGCQSLVESLKKEVSSTSSICYQRTDVRSYDDNLSLFALAYEKHGRIDHAFAIAGVAELPKENWFDPQLSIESVAAAPSMTVVDVNLTGVLYFTRIAAVYLRQGNDDGSQDKSICILGSVASFKEQTGLFIYSPAKHGVLGLVRSTRKYLSHTHRIRINVVCPSMTKTRMSVETLRVWAEQGVPGNEPQEVADYVLTLASVPRSPYVGEMTGLAVFVEGGKGWEIEKDLDKCDASWIGEEMSRNAVKIEQALEYGLAWVDPK
ncbi:hypothetical protein AB5N19_12418 [Seiridium cardinale]